MSPEASTHRVFNQVPDLAHFNPFTSDTTLQAALVRLGGTWHAAALTNFGEALGAPETLQWAADANQYLPELHTHTRTGERIDRVRFDRSWHALLTLMRSQCLQALPFAEPRPGAWAARTAGYFLQAQIESGSLCPATMTFASIPVLQKETALFADLAPRLYAREHDARDLPWREKTAILIGMGMTEKQGGSDVRSNTTVAMPSGGTDGGEGRGATYAITGHKWFFSAPMCDAHLVVARLGAEDGPLSCFFVPRFRDDGSKNPIQIQRLKDKLGNRSNASTEVEFRGAEGILIGEEGRGIPTIIEMATHTRLDCVIGSAGLLRHALMQALHHARHRMAFGRLLADQPLMRNVLADLALESEAATAFGLRLARCFDEYADPAQALLARILTPAGKYWLCKRGPGFCFEAMEVMGGNGYVEDGPLARLYREAPVNSIWEGSGNVMCLDLLRAFGKTPAAREALAAELALAGDADAAFSAFAQRLLADLADAAFAQADEYGARRLAERIVVAVQAALLLRHAPSYVADAFVRSRLAVDVGGAYGRLPAGVDCAAILARALRE